MKSTSFTEMPDSDEAPLLTQADFDRASYRIGAKPVTKAQWQDAVQQRLRASVVLDPDLERYFRDRGGEDGFQALVNATLREAVQAKTMEELLRKVIREELHTGTS